MDKAKRREYLRKYRARTARFQGAQRADWHGVQDWVHSLPAPSVPTTAFPGTPEKVAVMCERAAQRKQLFHPNDNQRLPNATEYANAVEDFEEYDP